MDNKNNRLRKRLMFNDLQRKRSLRLRQIILRKREFNRTLDTKINNLNLTIKKNQPNQLEGRIVDYNRTQIANFNLDIKNKLILNKVNNTKNYQTISLINSLRKMEFIKSDLLKLLNKSFIGFNLGSITNINDLFSIFNIDNILNKNNKNLVPVNHSMGLLYKLFIINLINENIKRIKNNNLYENIIEDENKIDHTNINMDISNFNNNINNYKFAIRNYISNFTKFNSFLATEKILLYNFNNNSRYELIKLFQKANELLNIHFVSIGAIISKPVFKVIYKDSLNSFNLKSSINLNDNTTINNSDKKIVIQLFYYLKYTNNKIIYNKTNTNFISNHSNILVKYNDKFKILIDVLTKFFDTEVELQLIRLKRPFFESNILAHYLNIKSYSIKFVKSVSKVFKKAYFFRPNNLRLINQAYPSFLSGISVRLGGRTFKQRLIPKKTVQFLQRGNLYHENVKFVEKARFTDKTRRGSFSFTVIMGHVFK